MGKSRNNCDFEEYVQCFNSFLYAQKLNRSEERNAILRAVFNFDNHFTANTLHKKLDRKKCYVSQSTLYATLELLMGAGLIIKHHLPGQVTPLYEKFYGSDAHNHIHIEGSEEMIEFHDPRIDEIKKDIEKKYAIEVTNHAFTLYCKNKKQKINITNGQNDKRKSSGDS
jgi:Fur family ferric uptake transcriptional regulator